MENIKIGDVMVFEGRVTRISKEDGKCFLRSKYDGNWFFMNSLKHKHQSVTEENIKEYAGAYKNKKIDFKNIYFSFVKLYLLICFAKCSRIELITRSDEYNPELAALRYAIDVLEKEIND